MDSTAELLRLVENSFEGTWIPDEEGFPTVLVYTRRWSSGVLDVVTVLDVGKASGLRAVNVDLCHLGDLGDGFVVRWRASGTMRDVVTEALELPAPDGVPISARAADLWVSEERSGELWRP